MMNQITISRKKYDELLKNNQEIANDFQFIMANPQIYIQNEFAFEDGIIFVDDAPLFAFHRCLYSGKEQSEIGKSGFVIEAMNSSGFVVFYYGISLVDKVVGDLYVEPINDDAIKLFGNLSYQQIVFGYAYKFIIPLDKIQRSALNSRTILQKIPSDIERKHHGNLEVTASNPVRLTNGIIYRNVLPA